MGSAEWHYGIVFMNKGDGNNALKHFQNSLRYWEKTKAAYTLPNTTTLLGSAYYFLGDLPIALKYMEKGLKMQLDLGLPFNFSVHHVFLSLVHFDLNNFSEARAHSEQALKFAQTHHEKHFEGFSWMLLGRPLGKMEESQLHRAEECLIEGMRILEELKLKPFFSLAFLFLGKLYSHAGQKEKALENLKKAEGLYHEMGMDYWLARTRKVLERV
jgi:tetratricopeptide (TPR) repeat protein